MTVIFHIAVLTAARMVDGFLK